MTDEIGKAGRSGRSGRRDDRPPLPPKRDIHGWIALDKPYGMTSTRAVGVIKRLLRPKKVGHAGTLDPLATGMLPIALGEATKTVPYVQDSQKRYRFTVRWGAATATDDREGDVVATSGVRPERGAIEAALPAFCGTIMQRPPAFSAIKVDGARAYDLARDGEAVDLPPRPIHIDDIALVDCPDVDHAVLEIACGKGTYVRALARDLAEALGTRGHVSALARTAVGPFDETHAISLDRIEELGHNAPAPIDPAPFLFPVETALDDIPALAIGTGEAVRLKRGQAILLRGSSATVLSGPAFATERGTLVAIGEVERGSLVPKRVFNL
ncbi:MAG: tRNA pseudouridine(55) synthase TruB [Pseudomonadota bacterium]